jgi:hypothetical protein
VLLGEVFLGIGSEIGFSGARRIDTIHPTVIMLMMSSAI